MNKLLLNKKLLIIILIFTLIVLGYCAYYLVNSLTDDRRACPEFQTDIREIVLSFNTPGGRVMSIAHRTDWHNYPENSLEAIKSCIDMGVDIVEIDVQKTSDGVLVLCHDITVNRTTDGMGFISNMTYDEIKRLYLREGKGGPGAKVTKYKMPTLAAALELTKGKIMINLDKATGYKDEIYDMLVQYDCLDTVMFKDDSSADEIMKWFNALKAEGKAVPLFVCKSGAKSDYELLETADAFIQGDSSQMIEMSFLSKSYAAAKKENLDYIKRGMRTCCTMMFGIQAASLNDDETGWADVINMGYNTIMTDEIQELTLYLNAINNTRDAGVIEAEHFNDYSGVKVSRYDNLNKVVTGIGDKDSLIYRNIDFGSGKSSISLHIKSGKEGSVKIYIEGENNPRASIAVGESDDYITVTDNIGEIKGICNIKLVFGGLDAGLDYFSFS